MAHKVQLTSDGPFLSVRAACKITGCVPQTAYNRINKGMDPLKAVQVHPDARSEASKRAHAAKTPAKKKADLSAAHRATRIYAEYRRRQAADLLPAGDTGWVLSDCLNYLIPLEAPRDDGATVRIPFDVDDPPDNPKPKKKRRKGRKRRGPEMVVTSETLAGPIVAEVDDPDVIELLRQGSHPDVSMGCSTAAAGTADAATRLRVEGERARIENPLPAKGWDAIYAAIFHSGHPQDLYDLLQGNEHAEPEKSVEGPFVTTHPDGGTSTRFKVRDLQGTIRRIEKETRPPANAKPWPPPGHIPVVALPGFPARGWIQCSATILIHASEAEIEAFCPEGPGATIVLNKSPRVLMTTEPDLVPASEHPGDRCITDQPGLLEFMVGEPGVTGTDDGRPPRTRPGLRDPLVTTADRMNFHKALPPTRLDAQLRDGDQIVTNVEIPPMVVCYWNGALSSVEGPFRGWDVLQGRYTSSFDSEDPDLGERIERLRESLDRNANQALLDKAGTTIFDIIEDLTPEQLDSLAQLATKPSVLVPASEIVTVPMRANSLPFNRDPELQAHLDCFATLSRQQCEREAWGAYTGWETLAARYGRLDVDTDPDRVRTLKRALERGERYAELPESERRAHERALHPNGPTTREEYDAGRSLGAKANPLDDLTPEEAYAAGHFPYHRCRIVLPGEEVTPDDIAKPRERTDCEWNDRRTIPGYRCSACHGEVRESPSGPACKQGHGGAEEPGVPQGVAIPTPADTERLLGLQAAEQAEVFGQPLDLIGDDDDDDAESELPPEVAGDRGAMDRHFAGGNSNPELSPIEALKALADVTDPTAMGRDLDLLEDDPDDVNADDPDDTPENLGSLS